jgi:hypothetical protein
MFNIIISLSMFCISGFVLFMQFVFPVKGIDGAIIYLAAIACCIGSLAFYNESYRAYVLSKLRTK